MAVVFRRQRHVLGLAGGARCRAAPRHPRGPAFDGRRQVLHRTLPARGHRADPIGARAGSDCVRRKTRCGAGRVRRRGGALGQAEIRHFDRRLYRLLSQPRRAARRARRYDPFPCRGPARIYRARVHSRLATFRPVRRRSQRPHQALCQARLHHGRSRDIAALFALCARARGLGRPAAQHLARDDPGKSHPDRDPKGRDQPRAGRPREARGEGGRDLRQDLGQFRRRAEGGYLRRFRAPRRAACAVPLQDHRRGGCMRSLKEYIASLKENQTAIYYLAGDDIARLEASPHLEGFRARGVEVLLLADPIDSFWVTSAPSFEGKPFKSVTQGAADLALIPRLDAKDEPAPETDKAVTDFLALIKDTLGEAVSDVRASDRLTDSAVCLVAPETGLDRQLEKILAGTGRIKSAAKPILEINPRHDIVVALAALGDEDLAFKQDAAHLLFDEARVLDGDRPADARMFCERLARILTRSLGKKTG